MQTYMNISVTNFCLLIDSLLDQKDLEKFLRI